jgi:hypothetical protein
MFYISTALENFFVQLVLIIETAKIDNEAVTIGDSLTIASGRNNPEIACLTL